MTSFLKTIDSSSYDTTAILLQYRIDHKINHSYATQISLTANLITAYILMSWQGCGNIMGR